MDKTLARLIKNLEKNEQAVSTALGGLVVLVVLFVGYQIAVKNKISFFGQSDVEIVSEAGSESGLPTTYVVQPGEGLSAVAEKFYGDRELWPEIMKANKIVDPDLIETGVEIIVPAVQGVTLPAAENSQAKDQAFEMPGKYVVKKGDFLTQISREVYGSGDRWVDILKANQDKIANPEILIEGTELVIPE